MTFGERLRELRLAAELTQDQLAERTGISVWTLRGYEQGHREPTWRPFLLLCRALEVDAMTAFDDHAVVFPEKTD